MIETFIVASITFIILIFAEKILLNLVKIFGIYTIVGEKEAQVFVLFGNIVGVIQEPGLHFLPAKLGWQAFFVKWLGKTYYRNLGLNQLYLRSIPVNTDEGTPMGIGVWFEMFIVDPIAHIFKNIDPQGSLIANVKNSTIKSLSNLPLAEMLVNRHQMSAMVRDEVTKESEEWGYKLGSVYIRKVHFRDVDMIKKIEEKIVNQLRQVTSAIEQHGKNQVDIISSKAEQQASIEFAKAAAIRPKIVGDMLFEVSKDDDVLKTLYEILEIEKLIKGNSDITILPKDTLSLLTQMMAAKDQIDDK